MLISSAIAQSTVVVFSEDGDAFFLLINSIKQNQNPVANMKVTGLNASAYSCKIVFANGAYGKIISTINPLPNQENTFIIKKKKYISNSPEEEKYTISFLSSTPLNINGGQLSNGQMEMPLNININTNTTSPNNENVNMNVNGMNMGMNVNTNTPNPNANPENHHQNKHQEQNQEQHKEHHQAESTKNNSNANSSCKTPMNAIEFTNAKKSILSKSFESSKVEMAKQITDKNCLTALQINQMMKLFSFESSRLDYAKFAHEHCFDKKNYYQVNDAFQFEHSIIELNEAIGK